MFPRNLTAETLDAIQAAGFDVYQAAEPRWQSYAYFTDGIRIGYIQTGDFGGLRLSTVHIPNRTTGTGFALDDCTSLERAELEKAFIFAPSWAYNTDRESVRKWADIAAFLKGQIYPPTLVRKGAAK